MHLIAATAPWSQYKDIFSDALGDEHAHVYMYACKHKLMSIRVRTRIRQKSDVNCMHCYNETVVTLLFHMFTTLSLSMSTLQTMISNSASY